MYTHDILYAAATGGCICLNLALCVKKWNINRSSAIIYGVCTILWTINLILQILKAKNK